MKTKLWFACLSLFAVINLAFASPTPLTLKVVIPDYIVSKIGGLDEVTIPGGQLLTSEWRPQVPYYLKSIEYPENYRIQAVVMKNRTDVKVDSGLQLPPFHTDEAPPEIHEARTGIFPQKDYGWSVRYEPGGPTQLTINIYPFYYDPQTTQVTFYKNYEFEIRYAQTTVAIGSIGVDKPIYDPGEKVTVGLRLSNSGKAQEITVAATLYKAFSNEKVATVPAKSLKKLGTTDSVALEWSTTGFPTGDYEVEAVVKDPKGNELDRKRTLFRLGNPQGEVTDFKVTPPQFKIGKPIELSMTFKNTGTCDLAGEAVFRIMTADSLVDELHETMVALKPGASTSFRKSWMTDNAQRSALYHAVGYVSYESGSSDAKNALFSTNLMPAATFTFSPEKSTVGQEIKFDAGASTDQDGKIVTFRWQFDDGGEAAQSTATHTYSQAGDYTVTLTVTDNEGGTASAKQILSVNE